MLKNKSVLVTGSEGQLGKTLQKRCLNNHGFDWIFLPKEELDIMEVDTDIVAMNCGNYGYSYAIIKSTDLLIPKIKTD